MIKKNFSKALQRVVRTYFQGQFETSFSGLMSLESEIVSYEQSRSFRRILSIFYLGQLLDLPSLNAILLAHGIRSTTAQLRFNDLCKSLTNNKIRLIFESIFSQILQERFAELCAKSDSTWSRMDITAVLDDSIFRQWLSDTADFGDYFKSWFSGQVGRTVHGFKVLTFGLTIDGVFYPLFLEFVKKEAQNPAQNILTAIKTVEKWGEFVAQLRKKGIDLPKIPLSCDSGYSDKRLEQACQTHQLTYISVPKKSHILRFDNREIKIAKFIEDEFLPAEAEHNLAQKDKKNADKTPFTLRIRSFYKVLDKEVTLLFFRLNNSKKVSVIYCTDKNITAKSLRRHWFERTQIEQFFRLLKHTLKIQEAKTKTKNEFECKLFRFAFIALHAQLFTRYVRKKIKLCRRFGFEQIRRCIIFQITKIDILDKEINDLLHQKYTINHL